MSLRSRPVPVCRNRQLSTFCCRRNSVCRLKNVGQSLFHFAIFLFSVFGLELLACNWGLCLNDIPPARAFIPSKFVSNNENTNMAYWFASLVLKLINDDDDDRLRRFMSTTDIAPSFGFTWYCLGWHSVGCYWTVRFASDILFRKIINNNIYK